MNTGVRSLVNAALAVVAAIGFLGCEPAKKPAGQQGGKESQAAKAGDKQPGPQVDKAAQDAAVGAIEKIKGTVKRNADGDVSSVSLVKVGAKDEDLKSLAALPLLEQLSVSSPDVTNAGLAVLKDLPNLRTLDLEECRIGATSLEVLVRYQLLDAAKMPAEPLDDGQVAEIKKQLKPEDVKKFEAEFEQGRHCDRWMADLKGLAKLEELKLTRTDIRDVGCRYLATIPKIKRLYMARTYVTDAGLRALSQRKTIEVIDLQHDNLVSDAGLECAATLPKLKSLKVYGPQVTDAGLAHLSGTKTLRVLGLDDTAVTDAGMEHLKSLSLEELYLFRTRVGDPGLQCLKGMTNMVRFRLRDTSLTDAGMAILKDMKNLKFLDLSENPTMTDAGLENLKELDRLEELNLGSTETGDAGVEQLANLANLKTLNLSKTRITNAGLDHLKGLQNLRALDLSETEVDDDGLLKAAELPQLKSLSVKLCSGVSSKGVKKLKQARQDLEVEE